MGSQPNLPKRQIQIVAGHHQISGEIDVRMILENQRERLPRPIHVSQWLKDCRGESRPFAESDAARPPPLGQGDTVPIRKNLDYPKASIVTRVRVLGSRVSQPNDQSLQRLGQ